MKGKFILIASSLMAIPFWATLWFLFVSKIQMNGTVLVKGVKNEVLIRYDSKGLIHIKALTEKDALFGLGRLIFGIFE